MRRTIRQRKFYRIKSRKLRRQQGGNIDAWLDNVRTNPYFYKFKEDEQKVFESFPIIQIDNDIKLNGSELIQIAAHLQFWFSKTDDIQVTNAKSFDAKLAKLMRQDFFTQHALPYIQYIEQTLRKQLTPDEYKTIYGTDSQPKSITLKEGDYPLLLWGLLGSPVPDPIPILSTDQPSGQV
jgi:hypothetical protein